MPPNAKLVDLLLQMFSADELRRFVRWGPDGDRLSRELPGGAVSAAELASRVVEVWAEHNAIDPALFDRLIEERPRRKLMIEDVRGACLGGAAPAALRAVESSPLTPAPEPSTNIAYLIAVALPLEQQAVASFLVEEPKELTLSDGTVVARYHYPERPDLSVGLIVTGKGNESAALVVSSAIRELSPRAVAFVGIAGGLKPDDTQLGDVVVATKVYGFEYGKAIKGGFQPRPEVANSAYRLQQRAQFEAGRPRWLARLAKGGNEGNGVGVHVQPIAAGSVRVASEKSDAAKRLARQYSDAYAVEMEGLGALKALDQQRVEGIIVRGISDFVGESIDSASARRSAANAAAFTLEMLANLA